MESERTKAEHFKVVSVKGDRCVVHDTYCSGQLMGIRYYTNLVIVMLCEAHVSAIAGMLDTDGWVSEYYQR